LRFELPANLYKFQSDGKVQREAEGCEVVSLKVDNVLHCITKSQKRIGTISQVGFFRNCTTDSAACRDIEIDFTAGRKISRFRRNELRNQLRRKMNRLLGGLAKLWISLAAANEAATAA
jgi:hypothetical protein